MKKALYFIGFSTLVGSLYFYFKKQLELALSYDYKIKTYKVLNFNDQEAEVEITIELQNKSAFEVTVNQYDITLFYKGIKLARTFSVERSKILPYSTIEIKMIGNVQFKEAKQALLPLAQTILRQQPIEIETDGYVNVTFIGIHHTINFNKDKFEYSSDLLEEYGLAASWKKLKEKYNFLNKI